MAEDVRSAVPGGFHEYVEMLEVSGELDAHAAWLDSDAARFHTQYSGSAS